MRYIIEEILLPWIPSGSTTNYYIAENFDEMRKGIKILLERAKKSYHFTEDNIEDLTMWEDEDEDGYMETYLSKDEPYQSWSIAWRTESELE